MKAKPAVVVVSLPRRRQERHNIAVRIEPRKTLVHVPNDVPSQKLGIGDGVDHGWIRLEISPQNIPRWQIRQSPQTPCKHQRARESR